MIAMTIRALNKKMEKPAVHRMNGPSDRYYARSNVAYLVVRNVKKMSKRITYDVLLYSANSLQTKRGR